MPSQALVGETKCCAHRGASSTHPENTVAAFKEAVRLGADMIEFDVGLTSDGAPVILHDPTVDRTTDGSGPLESFTFEALRRLDAGRHKGEAFAGERIPTLQETLEAIPPGIVLNVHLKASPGVEDTTLDVLRRMGRLGDAVIAGEAHQMERVREIEPAARRCNLTGQGAGDAEGYIERCVELGVEWLQFFHPQVTPESVRLAHERGITVNCFFANDEAEMRRQIECGVDYILTDYPQVLLPLLGR